MQAPSDGPLPISYPTSTNGIIVLLNSVGLYCILGNYSLILLVLILFDSALVSPISNVWYRYRPMLTERRLQSCIIKGRLPNEGYTTLVRKFESVQDRVISCKNTTENFDRLVAQTLCKNYARQELFHRSLAVTALAFRAGCLASFRVRNRKYPSVGFTFRIFEATLMVFRGWQIKNLAVCSA